MSDPKSDAKNEGQAELRDLEPEVRELTAEEAEGAQGGLIALLNTQSTALPAVQNVGFCDGSVRTSFTGGV